jgi:hypothetical protein
MGVSSIATTKERSHLVYVASGSVVQLFDLRMAAIRDTRVGMLQVHPGGNSGAN